MPEVVREVVDDNYHRPSWVSWAALVIAIIALILAWMAYNRTGADLEDRIQTEVNQGIDSLQGQR